MLAAGTSHTPHKAPRGAQHYTKQPNPRHKQTTNATHLEDLPNLVTTIVAG